MNRISKLLLLFITLFLSFPALSTEKAPPASDQMLEQVLTLSGLNKQLNNIPEDVRVMVELAFQQNNNNQISDLEIQAIKGAIQGAYDAPTISGIVRGEIKSSLTEEDLRELLSWYKSDLGQKITMLEENAQSPEMIKTQMNASIPKDITPQRQKLIIRFIKALDASKTYLQIRKNSELALFTAFSTVLNPTQPANIQAFEESWTSKENQMKGALYKQQVAMAQFTYSEIDDSMLEKYIQFLQSSSAKKFVQSSLVGIQNAMEQANNSMAWSLATVFKHLKGI